MGQRFNPPDELSMWFPSHSPKVLMVGNGSKHLEIDFESGEIKSVGEWKDTARHFLECCRRVLFDLGRENRG